MPKQSSHRVLLKSGIRIPLTEHEDLRSYTDSTISTSLIHSIASVGNCERSTYLSLESYLPKSERCWTWGICQNEDPKSAVVVGLPHNSLKIFPNQGRMNFGLTVLTGISDPKLVFGFHSSHVVMSVLIQSRPKDWTLADKVLKKTPLDLQKRFPKYHACPKYLAAHRCG